MERGSLALRLANSRSKTFRGSRLGLTLIILLAAMTLRGFRAYEAHALVTRSRTASSSLPIFRACSSR